MSLSDNSIGSDHNILVMKRKMRLLWKDKKTKDKPDCNMLKEALNKIPQNIKSQKSQNTLLQKLWGKKLTKANVMDEQLSTCNHHLSHHHYDHYAKM